MEIYKFSLLASNKDFKGNFKKIEELYKLFSTAAENCNNGITFLRDGKNLEIESIERSEIIVQFTSKIPLKVTSRSLSAFSRELIRLNKSLEIYEFDEDESLDNAIYNKSLFKTILLKHEFSEVEPDDISYSHIAKTIIDLLFVSSSMSTEEAQNRDKVINQIKNLLIPYMSN